MKRNLTKKLQIFTVAVKVKANKVLTSSVYIPSNATAGETNEINEQYLDKVLLSTETLQIFRADFNVNLLKKNIELINLMSSSNLDMSQILLPTIARGIGFQKPSLNVCLSNGLTEKKLICLMCGSSDSNSYSYLHFYRK